MRPRATMPVVLYERVLAINSLAPPPPYTTAPVSPSYPCKRWSPPEPYLSPVPTNQTIMLLVPSVVLTKGDPHPFAGYTCHVAAMVGGLVAVMRKVRSALLPSRTATYVPWLVR